MYKYIKYKKKFLLLNKTGGVDNITLKQKLDDFFNKITKKECINYLDNLVPKKSSKVVLIKGLIYKIIEEYDASIIYKLNIKNNKSEYLIYISTDDITEYENMNYKELKLIILEICKILDELNIYSLKKIFENSIKDTFEYIETFIKYEKIYGLHHIVKIINNDSMFIPNKTIYLLGEIHQQKIDIDDNNITEGEFIKNILEYAPLFIDFYIEQNILDKKLIKTVTEHETDYMRDPKRYQADVLKIALYYCKEYSNVRCHFIDPRHSYMNYQGKNNLFDCEHEFTSIEKSICEKLKYLLDNHVKYMYNSIFKLMNNELFLSYIQYISDIIKYYIPDIDISSFNDKTQIINYITSSTINDILINFICSFHFGEEIINKKKNVNIKYIELIKKISSKIDSTILNFIKEKYKNHIREYFIKHMNKNLINNTERFQLCHITFYYYLYRLLVDFTLDYYLILRLFKNMNIELKDKRKYGPKNSKFILIHCGDAHISNLKLLFAKLSFIELYDTYKNSKDDTNDYTFYSNDNDIDSLNKFIYPFFFEPNDYSSMTNKEKIKYLLNKDDHPKIIHTGKY